MFVGFLLLLLSTALSPLSSGSCPYQKLRFKLRPYFGSLFYSLFTVRLKYDARIHNAPWGRYTRAHIHMTRLQTGTHTHVPTRERARQTK